MFRPHKRPPDQALRVALHAQLDRRIDENFDEFPSLQQIPRHLALGAERRSHQVILSRSDPPTQHCDLSFQCRPA
jgi:hypothetical protein